MDVSIASNQFAANLANARQAVKLKEAPKRKWLMDPANYLDKARNPILEVLVEYALERSIVPRQECTTARDVRQLLSKILAGLQKKINVDDVDQKERSIYSHERRCLAFLNEVLNTHAHEHDRDTRNIALTVSATFDFFLQSFKSKNNKNSLRKIRSLSDELLVTILSEYGSSVDIKVEEENYSARFDTLHDKLDKILLHVAEEKASEERGNLLEIRSTRANLEKLRYEIDLAARNRGIEMQGYQHLLQWRRIQDLIDTAPKTLEDLRMWSETLANYEENKKWFDRQIERWGLEIIALFREE